MIPQSPMLNLFRELSAKRIWDTPQTPWTPPPSTGGLNPALNYTSAAPLQPSAGSGLFSPNLQPSNLNATILARRSRTPWSGGGGALGGSNPYSVNLPAPVGPQPTMTGAPTYTYDAYGNPTPNTSGQPYPRTLPAPAVSQAESDAAWTQMYGSPSSAGQGVIGQGTPTASNPTGNIYGSAPPGTVDTNPGMAQASTGLRATTPMATPPARTNLVDVYRRSGSPTRKNFGGGMV